LLGRARLSDAGRQTDRYSNQEIGRVQRTFGIPPPDFKGMHYYSVFKDPRLAEASANISARRSRCQP
jgi:hypothetical protein